MTDAATGPNPEPHPIDLDEVAVFAYRGFDLDPSSGSLACHYALDGLEFTERIEVDLGGPPATLGHDAVIAAARLVYLLAGVSYYKAAAPPLIDLGDTEPTDVERGLLAATYLDGLGEFAFRNGLDLRNVALVSPRGRATLAELAPAGPPAEPRPSDTALPRRPLIPFGGGIDSIVTVEGVLAADPNTDAALFVMSRHGDRFAAIEEAAAVTGLPVLRAGRQLDPKVLQSTAWGFRNGHVPVTGIVSAVAVLAATLAGRDAVVMSNEWSASAGNLTHHGREVNHQWSKSLVFEDLLRSVIAATPALSVTYYSWLRPFSELWVAERFADARPFHDTFRSCNRSFRLDPAIRLDHWCGECDKCCFIDLILAPYLPAADLAAIFGGNEPLGNPDLLGAFASLVGTGADAKPFECVGDVDECRVAMLLAAGRPDRTTSPVLAALAPVVADLVPGDPAHHATRLHQPLGPHNVPDNHAPPDLLG